MEKTIEIPFGAKDSELKGWEYTIPEGMEAEIKDGKVIVREKESEDERIRKGLLRHFKNKTKPYWNEIAVKDIIDYLEKQKEQIVIKQNIIDSIRANTQPDWDFSTIPNLREEINRFFGKKFVLPHTEDTIITVSDVIRCAYHFYKFGQQEQKPAEWSEEYRKEDLRTRFAFYTYKDEDGILYLSNVFVEETSRNKGFGTKILQAAEMVAQTIGALTIRLKVKQNTPANDWYRRHGYGYLVFEDGYDWLEKNLEYLKPKQKWSEEDKVMLNNIIWSLHMKSIIKPLYEMDDRSRYKKYEDFLKALPERFNLQPKQEWSEEDEKNLQRAIQQMNLLEEYINNGSFLTAVAKESSKKVCRSVRDWLKSLRDNYKKCNSRWKPSKKQMEALEDAFRKDGGNEYRKVINSLYRDLEKLL